VDISPIVKKLT